MLVSRAAKSFKLKELGDTGYENAIPYFNLLCIQAVPMDEISDGTMSAKDLILKLVKYAGNRQKIPKYPYIGITGMMNTLK
ncbi:MAG TPA: hypothetical protein VK536_05545 [Candidatus Limnocylindrales bacterium]|nr:hypothetical protein [Candidatus Limnocylindrales bacterium]